MLEKGMTYTSIIEVKEENTALAMGSGDLAVFATPAMIALMENAAMKTVASFLPEDSTTVGGGIEASHLAPSPVGATIRAVAVLTGIEKRKLFFSIEVFQGDKLIGKATHIRFIVNRETFMGNLY